MKNLSLLRGKTKAILVGVWKKLSDKGAGEGNSLVFGRWFRIFLLLVDDRFGSIGQKRGVGNPFGRLFPILEVIQQTTAQITVTGGTENQGGIAIRQTNPDGLLLQHPTMPGLPGRWTTAGQVST